MKKESRHLLIFSFILSLIFLAICSKSSFLYPFNDWYDANNFLTMGEGIVHGLVPYRDLYEQKGPILYFLHAFCYMVPGPHFFGVYFLEVAAFTLFLFFAGKIIRLYLKPASIYWILPILSALLLSSESFCQGDSAEELCAGFLMVGLYYTLDYFAHRHPLPMSYQILFINGFLAGIILWIKYTLLGFHLAFMASLFFLMIKNKSYVRAGKSCLSFLGGMSLPGIPVFLYFAVNKSLTDLMEVYFYNNIFLYSAEKTEEAVPLALTILLRIGDTFLSNLQFSVFTILGVLVFLFTRTFLTCRDGKIMLLLESILTATLIYTGSNFLYYGYILCVFPVLGMVSIGKLLEAFSERLHIGRPQTAHTASASLISYGSILVTIVFWVFAYYKSPNTYMIGTKRSELAQYQFAEIINQTENASLLNYGFLDAGFYTVCDISPTERFFQKQNMSEDALPEMMDSQNSCIREQRVDYVIVRGEEVEEWILEYYSVVEKVRQEYEGANVQYILLKKKL